MRNILTSIFTFFLFAVGFALLSPEANAQNRAFHAQPVYESSGQNGNMVQAGQRTLTANVAATQAVDTPICVTEWVNGQGVHRGCVPSAHLAPGEGFQFNVMQPFSGPVTFSYRAPDTGEWHAINHADNTVAQYNWNTGTSQNTAHHQQTGSTEWM